MTGDTRPNIRPADPPMTMTNRIGRIGTVRLSNSTYEENNSKKCQREDPGDSVSPFSTTNFIRLSEN